MTILKNLKLAVNALFENHSQKLANYVLWKSFSRISKLIYYAWRKSATCPDADEKKNPKGIFPIFIYPKNLDQYLIILEHFVKNSFMFWSVICVNNTTIGFFIVIDTKAADNRRPKLPHRPRSPRAEEKKPEYCHVCRKGYSDGFPTEFNAD